MSGFSKTLLCRPTYGFSLFDVWTDAVPPRHVKYEILLPSGGNLPFPPEALGGALKTFHAATDAWIWFAAGYYLHPVYLADDSDEVSCYVIGEQQGEVFKSGPMPGGLTAALSEFARLTGVDITAADAQAGEPVFAVALS